MPLPNAIVPRQRLCRGHMDALPTGYPKAWDARSGGESPVPSLAMRAPLLQNPMLSACAQHN